jgi:hypothetical protein
LIITVWVKPADITETGTVVPVNVYTPTDVGETGPDIHPSREMYADAQIVVDAEIGIGSV